MQWWIWIIIVGVIMLISISILAWIVAVSNKLVILKNAVDRTFPLMNSKIKQYCEGVSHLLGYVERKVKKQTKAWLNLRSMKEDCLNTEGMINKAVKQHELSDKVNDYITYLKGKKEFAGSKRLAQLISEIDGFQKDVQNVVKKHNDCVEKYNAKRNKFPASMVSTRFKFGERKIWEV